MFCIFCEKIQKLSSSIGLGKTISAFTKSVNYLRIIILKTNDIDFVFEQLLLFELSTNFFQERLIQIASTNPSFGASSLWVRFSVFPYRWSHHHRPSNCVA